MSHPRVKAMHEAAWKRGQHRLGYRAGLAGDNAHAYTDADYRRGYREGEQRRASLVIDRRLHVRGEVLSLVHTASLDGEVIGDFVADSQLNWVGDIEGGSILRYADWRSMLMAYVVQRDEQAQA